MLNQVVLIVDDDPKITELLKAYFAKENFTVITADDGLKAKKAIKDNKPDVVVLDWMIPGIDGVELLKQTRNSGNNVPIIMLTARDEESDKLIGLELGADDYIAKPFSPKEVIARAKAVLRRTKTTDESSKPQLSLGKITIDFQKHEVLKNNKPITMTPIEFKILELFCERPGQVFSRLQIIEKVQGYDFEGYERTVDAHIKNLRKKIEDDPGKPKYLTTVFGIGYKLSDQDKTKSCRGN